MIIIIAIASVVLTCIGIDENKPKTILSFAGLALMFSLLLLLKCATDHNIREKLIADKKITFVCDSTGTTKLILLDSTMVATWNLVKRRE